VPETTDYGRIYDALYAKGYNNHPQGWGVKVGMLPWMVEHLDFETVLDVGCGRGQDVKFLLDAGKNAHGVDASGEAVNIACREVDSTRFSDRDLTDDVRWGGIRFDAVVSSDVLEHLEEADVPAAVERIVAAANRYVGLRTAAFETKSGERCGFGSEVIHPTRKPSEWWFDRVSEAAAAQGRTATKIKDGRGWFVALLSERTA